MEGGGVTAPRDPTRTRRHPNAAAEAATHNWLRCQERITVNPQAPLSSTSAHTRALSRTRMWGKYTARVMRRADTASLRAHSPLHYSGNQASYFPFCAAALESIHWRGSAPAGLWHPQCVSAAAVIQFSMPGIALESPVTCFCRSLSKVQAGLFQRASPGAPSPLAPSRRLPGYLFL